MSLTFKWRSGNSYTIKDNVIEADAECLGGGAGMLIRLQSISAVGSPKGEMETDLQSLVNYLAKEIIKQKRLGAFVITHKNKVLFSLDKELKSGTHIDTGNVKQISRGGLWSIMLRDAVAGLLSSFGKK